MGRDKALLEIGGVPMAARVASALRAAGASEVVAVGGDRAGLATAGLSTWADDHPGEGPLGAVLTALRRAAHPLVAAVACDLVEPDPAAVRAVVAAVVPGVDVAVPVLGDHRQWHAAGYRASARDALEGAFLAGTRSLQAASELVAVVEVAGLAPRALADADRPEDLPPTASR